MNLRRLSRLAIITTIITIACVSVVASYTGPKASFADSINPGVFALDSKPYGSTYEDWTIKFWQWLLPIPADKNPMTDTTGERCRENQNSSSPIFFLVFLGGGSAVRTCDVPVGKAILVPVNVVECSFAEMNVKTEEELRRCAEEDESSNPGLFLSVDRKQFKDLETYRVIQEHLTLIFLKITYLQQSLALHVLYPMAIGSFLNHYLRENTIFISKPV